MPTVCMPAVDGTTFELNKFKVASVSVTIALDSSNPSNVMITGRNQDRYTVATLVSTAPDGTLRT